VPTQDAMNKKGGGNAVIIGGSVGRAVGFVCIAILSIVLCVRNRGPRTRNLPFNEWPGHQGTAATSHVSLFPDFPSPQSTSEHTLSFPSHLDPQWTSAIGTLPSFREPENSFEFPANQNPSQVHQDPDTNIITRTSHQSQNILEFPSNPLQVYQDPGASIISGPAFQPPASPPPPSFHTSDFPSSVIDTQAMEA
jgi:hypothetical protein